MRFIPSLLTIAALSLFGEQANGLKVGLLSDLHLHLRYDPFWGPYLNDEGDCMVNGGVETDIKAPVGRYGCDCPATLLHTMLDEFVERHGKQDVIILTGDFAAHHTAMPYPEGSNTFPMLLATHAGVADLVSQKFPDTLIVPVFGNNDAEYHDNPVPHENEFLFYDYIFNLWFLLLPENSRQFSYDYKQEIYKTFIEGGYYRVDLTDDLSVLALNTLYFDSERSMELDSGARGYQQMEWFREQLTEESDRKFILASHVYAGTRYEDFTLFNRRPNQVYFELLRQHKDRIVVELAGHDHFASLRAHTDENDEPFHNIFVAPSVTPWYSNNPGVSSFEITDDLRAKNLRSTFLNLEPTIGLESPLPRDQLEFRELNY